MQMNRWMSGTSIREEKTSAELRDRMGIEVIGSVLKRNRLRWFGHVERKRIEELFIYLSFRKHSVFTVIWHEMYTFELNVRRCQQVSLLSRPLRYALKLHDMFIFIKLIHWVRKCMYMEVEMTKMKAKKDLGLVGRTLKMICRDWAWKVRMLWTVMFEVGKLKGTRVDPGFPGALLDSSQDD